MTSFRWLLVVPALLVAAPAPAQDLSDYVDRRIELLLGRPYDHKMISSGQNFPSVNVQERHRGELIILLRDGIPASSIRSHFGWSEAEAAARLAELVEAALVRREADGKYVPTVMVMSLGDVARYMPVSETLVAETAALITNRLPEIRRRYAAIDGFRHVPFEAASLLVLSDVLLDNWQINAVEREFLAAERPLRAGSRYYYSIQERAPLDPREAFGIYGNQYRGFGSATVGVYGNRRTDNPANFQTLDADDIERLFSVRPESASAFKEELLTRLVAAQNDVASLSANDRSGLAKLGWMRDGEIAIPVLDDRDDEALSAMADEMTPDLIALLEAHRSEVTRAYSASPYAAEVTFEEYFMWWYHLYYTAVTDRLIAEGTVALPESGLTTYLFVRN
ncbi:MAG: hypothetical protein PVF05_08995 [Gemmatimonadales bacterium]|jgi:hypothetical protein